jgi:LacI family transcriptional regulator
MIPPVATIADVAREAGVSIATVSRVLSPGRDPHPVSPATAQRVRQAARRLDYVPSALARGLASHRSGLLGFVVPNLADPHYPLIARGAEDLARSHGLSLLICNTLGDSGRLAEYLRVLRGRQVDALVVSGGGSLSPDDLLALARTGLPGVLIGRPAGATLDRPAGMIAWPWVSVDNRAAAGAATRHLLGGHGPPGSPPRRVAHLAGPAAQTTMTDRAAGYRDAMLQAGLPAEVVATDGSAEDGERAARALLRRPPDQRPDAIFAATDRLAIGALGVAIDLGLPVPDALALVGFDDLALGAHLRPSLSTVAQPAEELGAAALRLALARLAGEAVTPLVLPARLVVRASSANS